MACSALWRELLPSPCADHSDRHLGLKGPEKAMLVGNWQASPSLRRAPCSSQVPLSLTCFLPCFLEGCGLAVGETHSC